MKNILVTHATFSGSTVEVAEFVAKELIAQGFRASVMPVQDVSSLAGYDGVVIAAPMIMGWHRAASGFLKKNRNALKHIPFAVLITAMSLTQTGETSVDGAPVTVDAALAKPPAQPGRLSLRERYARVSNYVRPILAATRPSKPVSIGLFGGRLEYGRLKWWAVIFVMLIIKAPAGDRRNWPAIREWAAGVADEFEPESMKMRVPVMEVQPA